MRRGRAHEAADAGAEADEADGNADGKLDGVLVHVEGEFSSRCTQLATSLVSELNRIAGPFVALWVRAPAEALAEVRPAAQLAATAGAVGVAGS